MRQQRPSLKEAFSLCLPVVVRPVLNTEPMEPAGNGSSGNRFVFVTQPKIVVPLLGCRGNNWFASLLASRHNHFCTFGEM
jgi:hypothetical protein